MPLADQEAVRVVKHDWRVAHRLSLWLQADGRNLKPAADFVFGRGDFVEVTVFADIVSFWDTKAGKARAEIPVCARESGSLENSETSKGTPTACFANKRTHLNRKCWRTTLKRQRSHHYLAFTLLMRPRALYLVMTPAPVPQA